ncbi:glycerate kinase [Phycicoccus sp. BSK3Z-2]|uniref:Glycerate kinase n=2 Tax=Phycicoccus avicenniae TaxID=2828860 RepID=A0A941DD56_9MICO|nr:glycerate kinase [Phycicoccus avicenniae]
MTVVMAPDSFKGTLDAPEVAAALGAGWSDVRPQDRVVTCPMADGGEGTLAAVARSGRGTVHHPVLVHGPLGEPTTAAWLEMEEDGARVGLVEVASTSGITMADPLDGLRASSRGFGEAVVAALDAGVDRLVLALGGSASSDGGAGLLTALGGRLHDRLGRPVAPGNAGLEGIAGLDLSGLRSLPAGGAVVLSDVRNPLLGRSGAVRTYGPQKGIRQADLHRADERVGRLAGLVRDRLGGDEHAPGSGAAGGLGFTLAAWGARLVPGAEAVASVVGLPGFVDEADVVVTGEGRFDATSAQGKVVGTVSGLCDARAVERMLVAGSVEDTPTGFRAAVSLVDLAGATGAMSAPGRWVRDAGGRLAAGVT